MNQAGARARTARRSALATLEITGAAMLAHVLAGGHLPGPEFLVTFAAVVFGCCLAAIGRLVRVGAVVPFVMAAQIGLHAALEAGAGHAAAHAAMSGRMPGAAADAPLGLTPVMFWAHAVTALITGIVLLLQQRVLAAVVGWWQHVDLALHVLPALEPVPSGIVPAPAARVGLLRVSRRRGPPMVLAA